MNRRSFLSSVAFAGSGLVLSFSGLAKRAEVFSDTGNLSKLKAFGFGELIPTAAKNTGETYLALPTGFEYNVIGKVKGVMSDGQTRLLKSATSFASFAITKLPAGDCRKRARQSAKRIITTKPRRAARRLWLSTRKRARLKKILSA